MYRRVRIYILLAACLISSCTLPITFHINETESPRENLVGSSTVLSATQAAMPAQAAPNTTAATPIPNSTPPASKVLYHLQFGTPLVMKNFVHPESGCSWLGVGGQAFNTKGEPATGLIAKVGGSLAGQNVDQISITGSSLDFGPAGYEVKLGNTPIASTGTLWVQLLDLNGIPQSNKIFFDTYQSCEQNLVLINFTALNLTPRTLYFPSISSNRTTLYIPLIEKRYGGLH